MSKKKGSFQGIMGVVEEQTPPAHQPPPFAENNTMSLDRQVMAMQEMETTGLRGDAVADNIMNLGSISMAAEMSGRGYVEATPMLFKHMTKGKETGFINYGNIRVYEQGTKDKVDAFENMSIDDRLRVKSWRNL